MLENPLLKIEFAVPFDQIRAEHIQPAAEALMAEAQKQLDRIDAAAPPPYALLESLDLATENLDTAMGIVNHLESVASTLEIRNAYNAVQPEVSAFFASIPLDARLWDVLQRYAATDDARNLTGVKKRFLQKTLDDFKRNGAELPEAGKKRLKEISHELSQITTRYAQNVVDSTAAFELFIEDPAKLSGLPPSAMEAARISAESKGKTGFRFTLQAPSLTPLLTYLEDSGIREKVYRAYNARATQGELNNQPLILRILALRSEQAQLLGYENFADLVLSDRMAKTGAQARAFVEQLRERTRPAFGRENQALWNFRQTLEGPQAPPLQPWDIAFYAEKQRQALYDFNEEELRPYFPIDRVLSGMFETATRLYGIKIQPRTGLPTWNPAVGTYDIHDQDGTFLGSFYTDLFPREEKRGGAWMNGLITGPLHTPHLGLICANLTPPMDGRVACLTHSEVETLFHEFGHLLHHLLSQVEVRSLAGTNVAWDFVELPSQIMENWCWEREALDLFARGYETGQTIPESLFEKVRRARTYRAGNASMRQLGFAAVDLALHMDYDPAQDGDVIAYARAKMQAYAPAQYLPDYAFIASFSHLFAHEVGYASGYYSYKWAEVLDADAFTRFASQGIFSRAVGEEFRRKILERGNGADPMQLYRDFMGREPSVDALIQRSGLADPTPPQSTSAVAADSTRFVL